MANRLATDIVGAVANGDSRRSRATYAFQMFGLPVVSMILRVRKWWQGNSDLESRQAVRRASNLYGGPLSVLFRVQANWTMLSGLVYCMFLQIRVGPCPLEIADEKTEQIQPGEERPPKT